MRLPLIRRSVHLAAVRKLEDRLKRAKDSLWDYQSWHFAHCDCHDAWDQCPCAEAGHPKDGSCDCCDLGSGLCGPKPQVAS